ncbi:MAG: iron ABC transporter permease [Pseudomonadota bacterium]
MQRASALSQPVAAPKLISLGVLALALCFAELMLGPVSLHPVTVIEALFGQGAPIETAIVQQIRLPRLLLGCAVGVALAASGAALQGILRNPLADPGLIGVTAGASLGAVGIIVLGATLVTSVPEGVRNWLLPMGAFIGALVVNFTIFGIARRSGQTPVSTLILAGIALNAIAGAGIGAMIYLSDDQQLRDLNFWLLGGLGTAGWSLVTVVAIITLFTVPLLLFLTRALDLMQLGERAAFHAGLDVESCKLRVAIGTALSVGAVTAAAGPIGFIGLVAPHLARLLLGARHALVIPGACLLGVSLVLASDLVVRLAVPPAEPPIGLATSLIGGPFFLWLIIKSQNRHD